MAFDVKVTLIKHDHHSVKKGYLTVTSYLDYVKNMCDVISASGHGVLEQIQVVGVSYYNYHILSDVVINGEVGGGSVGL